MSDFEEKLEGILNNPQAMEQIMSLAKSLGGGSASSSGSQQTVQPSQPQPQPQQPDQAQVQAPAAPASGGLLDGLGQLDPRLLSAAAKLMSQYNSGDDSRTALLQALRPFVKEQRYAKLDKAIQIARLSRMIRMSLELFRSREDGNV